MKKTNIIKPFRIETELKEKIDKAIMIININNYLNIKTPDYIRMALNDFSNRVIAGELNITNTK